MRLPCFLAVLTIDTCTVVRNHAERSLGVPSPRWPQARFQNVVQSHKVGAGVPQISGLLACVLRSTVSSRAHWVDPPPHTGRGAPPSPQDYSLAATWKTGFSLSNCWSWDLPLASLGTTLGVHYTLCYLLDFYSQNLSGD